MRPHDGENAAGSGGAQTHEECVEIAFQVLSDPGLHEHASKGYKKVGQSVDLYGGEDGDICREAGKFWNEPTTDRYANMREKINTELAAVAEEFTSGGLTRCQRDVKRLICPYPAHRKIGKILANLGEDFSHDDIHNNLEAEEDDEEPEEIEKELETISDEEDLEDDEEIETAVAAKDTPAVVTVDRVEASNNNAYISPLSAEQADQLHIVRTTIGAIESSIESLKMSGVIRGAQCMEAELSKERRRERDLMHESPAVAETFLRLRRAEAQEFHDKQLLASQMKQRKQEASTAIAARNAAVAELKQTKRKLQELESARACKHAVKTFTLDVLGAGSANAGGAKARKNRFEVLDRLSRHQAGLSDAQKTISHGGRKLGMRPWSLSMAPTGQTLSQAGCRPSSTARAQMHSPSSRTTKRCVSSKTAKRWRSQAAESAAALRSRGSHIRSAVAVRILCSAAAV